MDENNQTQRNTAPPGGGYRPGTAPSQGGSALQTLTTAKGRIGVVGIVVVVILAMIFHVNPLQALNAFSGGPQQNTSQQQAPAQAAPAGTQQQ